MGDIWIRDTEITTLIVLCSVLIVLPIQLLLCFKVKKLFLRLLPSLIFAATTVFLFTMMRLATDWDALGYAIVGIFSGALLIFSGIAWGIWAIAKCMKRKKQVSEV